MGPFDARWTGSAFEPTPYFRQRMTLELKPGQTYRLEENRHRSHRSHQHFFAALNEAYENLNERGVFFPSAEHLRKWCLTFTPFCNVNEHQAATETEAIRVAMSWHKGLYSRVEISADGLTVRQFIPHSQAYSAMSHAKFQKSKDAVFIVLAQQLGCSVEALEEAGRRAA